MGCAVLGKENQQNKGCENKEKTTIQYKRIKEKYMGVERNGIHGVWEVKGIKEW